MWKMEPRVIQACSLPIISCWLLFCLCTCDLDTWIIGLLTIAEFIHKPWSALLSTWSAFFSFPSLFMLRIRVAICVQVSPISSPSCSNTRSDHSPDIIKVNKFPDLRIQSLNYFSCSYRVWLLLSDTRCWPRAMLPFCRSEKNVDSFFPPRSSDSLISL